MLGVPFVRAKTQALAHFTDTGPDRSNCAQAIVDFGPTILGQGTDLVAAARYFGGGVGGMGCTCGAITGTAATLGLRDHLLGTTPETAASTRARLQELIRDFEEEFGAGDCRHLTGHNLTTAEGVATFRLSPAHHRCATYVGWMCDHLFHFLTATEET